MYRTFFTRLQLSTLLFGSLPVLLLYAARSPLPAQVVPSPPEGYIGPILQIAGEDVLDFGEVSVFRENLRDTVSITNTGEDTLWIYSVRSATGYMVAHPLRRFILPHDTVEAVEVLMDASARRGLIRTQFTIYSNDTSRNSLGTQIVPVRCAVHEEIEWWWNDNKALRNSPLYIKSLETGTVTTRQLHIRRFGDSAVTFGPVRFGNMSDLRIEIPSLEEEWTLEPGEEKEVNITIRLTEIENSPRRGTHPTASFLIPVESVPSSRLDFRVHVMNVVEQEE